MFVMLSRHASYIMEARTAGTFSGSFEHDGVAGNRNSAAAGRVVNGGGRRTISRIASHGMAGHH
jgi:hypothetical protein